jgi:uncharacterized protein
MRQVFVKDSFLSARPEEVFGFHELPDAFARLTPPGSDVEVRSLATTLRPSSDVVRFTKRVLAVPFDFEMVHTVYRPPELFVDEQLRGPFSYWRHEHRFARGGWAGDPATWLQDRITYGHPLLFPGNFAVRLPLSGLFERRHEITRRAICEAVAARRRSPRRTIAMTGGTGLIGRRVAEILAEKGERVVLLVRDLARARRLLGPDSPFELASWDFTRPGEGDWRAAIAEADGVIHLAGTPLFERRWSPEFKREMKESRTSSTRQLVEAIAASEHKPAAFVCASAVGVYGVDPAALVSERSPVGDDLLADICTAWEAEARAVERVGVRSVQIRTGVVLSTASGALKEMLLLFKLGLGGVLGRPTPWVNWIHLEDVARIFLMALDDPEATGPLDAVAPHPVINRTFAHSVSHVLRRPCLMAYPEVLLRAGIGEAARYAAGGPRVLADRVQELGYTFFFPELEPALRHLLRRP